MLANGKKYYDFRAIYPTIIWFLLVRYGAVFNISLQAKNWFPRLKKSGNILGFMWLLVCYSAVFKVNLKARNTVSAPNTS